MLFSLHHSAMLVINLSQL